MGRYYRNPGAGSLYQHCALCRRPFHIYRSSLLKNNGKFCSMKCYHKALRLFSEALASDRLELILGNAPQKVTGTLVKPGGVWSGGYGG